MTRKIIEINNLHYTYPDGSRALAGITLDVFEGDSVGIIGSNGAGKSTFLLHLNGILRSNGAVRIKGMEMTDKNLPHIRSMVGLVFQDPDNQLFMPTVFDDVGFGPINMGLKKNEVETRVQSALKEVDMLAFVKKSSHHLSIGEKKRVAIATVLSMNPQILVLDEPTSNLDPKRRQELIDLLNRLSLTKIIAAHDLDLISQTCSKIALMDQGRIVALGPASNILHDETTLAILGIKTHDLISASPNALRKPPTMPIKLAEESDLD
jgi:cobalt/nickel transport system ATP-binding protein